MEGLNVTSAGFDLSIEAYCGKCGHKTFHDKDCKVLVGQVDGYWVQCACILSEHNALADRTLRDQKVQFAETWNKWD